MVLTIRDGPKAFQVAGTVCAQDRLRTLQGMHRAKQVPADWEG